MKVRGSVVSFLKLYFSPIHPLEDKKKRKRWGGVTPVIIHYQVPGFSYSHYSSDCTSSIKRHTTVVVGDAIFEPKKGIPLVGLSLLKGGTTPVSLVPNVLRKYLCFFGNCVEKGFVGLPASERLRTQYFG